MVQCSVHPFTKLSHKADFFFPSLLPFGGSTGLYSYSRASGESNAIPTEPRGRLVDASADAHEPSLSLRRPVTITCCRWQLPENPAIPLHLQKFAFSQSCAIFRKKRSLQQFHFRGRKHIGFLDFKKWSSPVPTDASYDRDSSMMPRVRSRTDCDFDRSTGCDLDCS